MQVENYNLCNIEFNITILLIFSGSRLIINLSIRVGDSVSFSIVCYSSRFWKRSLTFGNLISMPIKFPPPSFLSSNKQIWVDIFLFLMHTGMSWIKWHLNVILIRYKHFSQYKLAARCYKERKITNQCFFNWSVNFGHCKLESFNNLEVK